ncbi:GNAT family N-acetyltransferase [Streptomyces stramineus]|uniref:GNAT family N-acetyltransferase n=1 Tax=Streptomyces stramineus TaxID=173861 RepID=A0ABN0ZUS7_9ACTN
MDAPATARPAWVIAPEPVGSGEVAGLLREYLTDVADRWYRLYRGRAVTAAEIEGHLAEDPSDDLAPPTGVLLVARHHEAAVGCVGLRWRDEKVVELKRMYVRPAHRGAGGAAALLAAAEQLGREWGAERIVLDTRKDLVEALALYARHGYAAVPRYNTAEDAPYSEVWLGKALR